MDTRTFVKYMMYALENQASFVCRELSEENFRWRSQETNNPSIGWYLGHLLVFNDFIMNHVIFDKGYQLPEFYRENFHFQSDGNMPEDITSEVLFNKFKELNASIVQEILIKDETWFGVIPNDTSYLPPNWQGKNNGKLLVLHFNHGFTHLGQMLEIRRNMGKDTWGSNLLKNLSIFLRKKEELVKYLEKKNFFSKFLNHDLILRKN